MKRRLLNVIGARPNFMKMAPLWRAYQQHPAGFEPLLVHTGQHYDPTMSERFLTELGLPAPRFHLGIGAGSVVSQTVRIMAGIGELLERYRPELVVVVGDVTSTLAAALAAARRNIPLAHVEAGLRSFDTTMPEEINRIVTDSLSQYCFTPSADADQNLAREGIPAERIHRVGNIMIDSLQQLKPLALARPGRPTGPYGLVTLHRPSNVDDPARLADMLGALERIHRQLPLLFPVHPRTAARLAGFGLRPRLDLRPPLGYLDTLNLMAGARLVLTDSGGVQEETTALGVPCLTLRENTERPITITAGTNTLVGTDPARIVAAAEAILAGRGKSGRLPALWDGQTAQRIVKCLLQ